MSTSHSVKKISSKTSLHSIKTKVNMADIELYDLDALKSQ